MSLKLHDPTPYQSPKIFPILEADADEAKITVQLKPAEFRQAEVNQWFFLQPELKGANNNGSFLMSTDMEVLLAVRPDLLYRFKGLLREWDDDVEAMLQALAWEADQPHSEPDPLLRPDGWLCLQVNQKMPSGMTGFKTIWDKVLPRMAEMGIGPKDLDFQHIELYIKGNQTESEDAGDIQINIGEDSTQILAAWEVPKNKRHTDAVPIDEDEPGTGQLSLGLLGAVSRMLEGKSIPFSLRGKDRLRFAHSGRGRRWSCEALVQEADHAVSFFSLFPLAVPEAQRDEVQQWLQAVNAQIPAGGFILDLSNGDLRFKNGQVFSASSGLDNQLQQLWLLNTQTFDQYYDQISQLLAT